MFELFVIWLHDQSGFRKHLEETINGAISPGSPSSATADEGIAKLADPCTLSQRLHWALVRLHLFASNLALSHVQDAAMDAIQDLYLRRDWDVTPRLIRFLYAQCNPTSSLRIRRWAVAMVAFTLSSANTLDRSSKSVPAQFHELFKTYPDFSADYANHLRKMAASGLELRVKNPQLRVPTNRLRSEERRFAFRHCAFHTHRASVGEGRCPHLEGERRARRGAMLGEGSLSEQVRGQLAVQRPGMVISVMDLVVDPDRESFYGEPTTPPTEQPQPQKAAVAVKEEVKFEPMVSVFDVPKPLRRMRSMRSVAARARVFLQHQTSQLITV